MLDDIGNPEISSQLQALLLITHDKIFASVQWTLKGRTPFILISFPLKFSIYFPPKKPLELYKILILGYELV